MIPAKMSHGNDLPECDNRCSHLVAARPGAPTPNYGRGARCQVPRCSLCSAMMRFRADRPASCGGLAAGALLLLSCRLVLLFLDLLLLFLSRTVVSLLTLLVLLCPGLFLLSS